MNVPIAVGGGRLDMLGGGWDGWPLVGAVVALWIGRRILQVPWGVGLLIGVLGMQDLERDRLATLFVERAPDFGVSAVAELAFECPAAKAATVLVPVLPLPLWRA